MDYSLYLVTDPHSDNCEDVVQQAVDNGCTLVQLREKTMDTGALIAKAQRIHKITSNAGIPLLINDRVDVCLAMGAEGVHIGQDDMPPAVARQLLGPDKIIGVSVRDMDELKVVLDDGVADYIGIGAVYATQTKKLDKPPMGVDGVRDMLKYLYDNSVRIPSVIIGGLSLDNSAPSITKSAYHGRRVDGVAVVSCITGAEDPGRATRQLRESLDVVYGAVMSPAMVLHVTNTVVQNLSANVTLALGASAFMSYEHSEYAELAQLPNTAVVVNTGSPKSSQLEIYSRAMEAYKGAGKHVIFDPVGVGATPFRRQLNASLFKGNVPDIVKCNVSEALALIQEVEGGYLAGSPTMRGVDSTATTATDSSEKLLGIVRPFCQKHNVILAITGKVDLVCSSTREATVVGGDVLLTRITGTGCALSSVIACSIAGLPLGDENIFDRVVDALSLYKHCARRAGQVTQSPGSFLPVFLDELMNSSVC